ncbi:NAD(P)H-dependent glycerol-3-phosphate dehydrogenase [Lacticaseibacillus camelliae]|uniref:Glycerol-3-phosphate dehydrogenase [NAD(P)+] n=1 Tax=Lacticaseibacillus camelliae DSM 22697 = JCM 13995 TaxID=1423730 RepID=A0A0R2EWH1_9LACO|nr:NAD(P)H-dependent glycerol-3-phosphate dehydrogenase [Lacticaseibacillus camelliae]KRN20713.1 NAD(P)H-dependent glycerol-3-phosphate dehydrogenase [Lacticaseibacillus camelliae DSM 22697 = JCM 13995]
MTDKIAVLGAGSWGTVLANLLVENGLNVALWTHNPKQIPEINETHHNQHYLPDFVLHDCLRATTDLAAAVAGATVILFVVPTNAIRSVAEQVAPLLTDQQPIIAHAAKGLELNTKLRVSQVLTAVLPKGAFRGPVVISGPSHAEDVATRDITTLTVASTDLQAAQTVQKLFMNDYFRLYTNTDVLGVELGAALKNVIAIGAGALHGLGYGDNTKAALMTRGLAEITRLGTHMGANPMTFIGLSGVGDLIVTCTSVHSRNWRAGNALGQGEKLPDVLAHMGMVVEGVSTAKVVHELAKDQDCDMPISEGIYQVLYQGAPIKTVITDLMAREGKPEFDFGLTLQNASKQV